MYHNSMSQMYSVSLNFQDNQVFESNMAIGYNVDFWILAMMGFIRLLKDMIVYSIIPWEYSQGVPQK